MLYMYNGHADVTALINTSTAVIEATYYYDAFGNILEQTGTANNSINYAGYQWDKETGLYYLNSRMYDPTTARFMQEDTYTGDINDPLSLNLYSYCHQEPLMYSDPTGHWDIWGDITGGFSKISSGVSNVGNRVTTGLSNAGSTVKTAVVNTASTVKATVVNTVNAVKATVVNTANKVRTEIVNTVATLKTETNKLKKIVTTATVNGITKVKKQIEMASASVAGSASAALSNVTFGLSDTAVKSILGRTFDEAADSNDDDFAMAYYSAKTTTDRTMIAIGLSEIAAGTTGEFGGGAISVTGVGAAIGVPAMAVSTGVIAHGGAIAGYSTSSLMEDQNKLQVLQMSGNKGSSSGGSLNSQRQKAVRDAWKEEQDLVNRTGQGTRPWTEGEKQELLETGKVKDYEGHHINSVKSNPDLAGKSDNIDFLDRSDHLDAHAGSWRNPTSGDLKNRR